MGFSPIAWSKRKRLRPYLAVAAAVALGAGAAAGATAASASTSVSRAFAGYKSPATVSTDALPRQHQHADQAPRRALRRERVVRPLLRHLPVRGEHRRHQVRRQAGHPDRERPLHQDHQVRPGRPAAHEQPERVQPAAADELRGPHLRPEPRLHAGAEGRRRRQDGPVRPEHRVRHAGRGLRPRVLPARHRHGLLRRQHRHRAVELRAELLDERQRLGHHLRPVHPWRAQRDLR